MDLFLKVGIIVVVLIVVAGIGFILFQHAKGSTAVTSDQAVQFVKSDLIEMNPSANITTINVSPSRLQTGSWDIVLSIVYNATRPCPTLLIQGFDYPATGLVPSLDNLYTTKCVIYGMSDAPSYVISSPLIATARSYNESPKSVSTYVSAYGYNNTVVHSKFYTMLNSSVTGSSRNFTNVWLVNYTANRATYSEYLVMDSSGTVIANYSG
ncbi:MAG TPA: hypothetical protein VND15_03140 [Candidatus Acidoferrales bacterium]|nr:hypothetical protein [Candidatus Acidoferrales bacterium]